MPPACTAIQHRACVRLAAILLLLPALGACGGTPRKPLDVPTALGDPNPAVRTDAVNALRQTRDVDQVPRLIEMLDDPDDGVRMSAVAALEDLTGRRTDYRPWGDAEARREAVLEWRAWWASRPGASGARAVKKARPDTVRLTLPSHPKFLPLVRALVEQGAALAGFEGEACERIVLGVTEGVTNVMRHGYRGCRDQRIDLVLFAPRGEFCLEIHDYGCFVDPEAMQSRPLDDVRPGGLGVHLMKSTMDRVEYRKNACGGTTLTLRKRLPEGGDAATPQEEEA